MAEDTQTRAAHARYGAAVRSLALAHELAPPPVAAPIGALVPAQDGTAAADLGDGPAAGPSFPELLRSHRTRVGLTQRTLAGLSTISSRTIRDLESGRANARTQTVQLLADALRLQGLTRELFVRAALGGRPSGPAEPDLGAAVPRGVNTLIGRDPELRTLVEALESGRRRMVSLSGLPGAGKSRVAAEVAARLSALHGWPVLWIGTGPAPDAPPGTSYGGLLRALRALIDSGEPDIARIHRIVGCHEVLLAFDGVADIRIPRGIGELLAYCPGVRVISTSRAPWQIAGVHPTVVPPLAVPGPEWDAVPAPPEDLLRVPSVRLLVDRLSEIRPGFALGPADAAPAVRLCRRLDGLPLAIEAVAGRFRVLTLHQLAELPAAGLLDLPLPHRGGSPETIGGLLAAVCDRLSPKHRAILGQVSRLEAGWTVSEAAALLRLPLTEAVDDLGVLIAHGLVRASHAEPAGGLSVPNLLRAHLER